MPPESANEPLDLRDDRWCFVCGTENPFGLHVAWRRDEDGFARGSFHPDRRHQGWSGVMHGGILAALLDEAMAQRLKADGIRAVTAGLSIRYRRPSPTSGLILAEAEIVTSGSRVIKLAARILDDDGTVLAEADGSYVKTSVR